MNWRPNNLKGRVVKLERLRRPKGDRFFMIWGRDKADLERKLAKAKAEGDLLPGDRFDTRIWTNSSAPSPPRWTRLDEMSRGPPTWPGEASRRVSHLIIQV